MLGLRIFNRRVLFSVADNKHNREVAAKLLDDFSQRWLDAFPAHQSPTVAVSPLTESVEVK